MFFSCLFQNVHQIILVYSCYFIYSLLCLFSFTLRRLYAIMPQQKFMVKVGAPKKRLEPPVIISDRPKAIHS